MRHLDLFAGIGGFSLAARWAGWETIAHCEIEPFCQKVLHKNYPNSKIHGNIKELDGNQYRGTVDIITGGFPCQPFSLAGKRLGTDDSRHLWPEMFRIIQEVRPKWIVGENVFGILDWSDGMVFEMVCADLENEGYEVAPFILPAAGAGSPHRRDRCWFVAHSSSAVQQSYGHEETRRKTGKAESEESKREWNRVQHAGIADKRSFANANIDGLEVWKGIAGDNGKELTSSERSDYAFNRFPSVEPGIRRGNDGVPHRMDRIKALGNAIVPQVAYQIFKAINQYNSL